MGSMHTPPMAVQSHCGDVEVPAGEILRLLPEQIPPVTNGSNVKSPPPQQLWKPMQSVWLAQASRCFNLLSSWREVVLANSEMQWVAEYAEPVPAHEAANAQARMISFATVPPSGAGVPASEPVTGGTQEATSNSVILTQTPPRHSK